MCVLNADPGWRRTVHDRKEAGGEEEEHEAELDEAEQDDEAIVKGEEVKAEGVGMRVLSCSSPAGRKSIVMMRQSVASDPALTSKVPPLLVRPEPAVPEATSTIAGDDGDCAEGVKGEGDGVAEMGEEKGEESIGDGVESDASLDALNM